MVNHHLNAALLNVAKIKNKNLLAGSIWQDSNINLLESGGQGASGGGGAPACHSCGHSGIWLKTVHIGISGEHSRTSPQMCLLGGRLVWCAGRPQSPLHSWVLALNSHCQWSVYCSQDGSQSCQCWLWCELSLSWCCICVLLTKPSKCKNPILC